MQLTVALVALALCLQTTASVRRHQRFLEPAVRESENLATENGGNQIGASGKFGTEFRPGDPNVDFSFKSVTAEPLLPFEAPGPSFEFESVTSALLDVATTTSKNPPLVSGTPSRMSTTTTTSRLSPVPENGQFVAEAAVDTTTAYAAIAQTYPQPVSYPTMTEQPVILAANLPPTEDEPAIAVSQPFHPESPYLDLSQEETVELYLEVFRTHPEFARIVEYLSWVIEDHDSEIAELDATISMKVAELSDLDGLIATQQALNNDLQARIDAVEQQIQALESLEEQEEAVTEIPLDELIPTTPSASALKREKMNRRHGKRHSKRNGNSRHH